VPAVVLLTARIAAPAWTYAHRCSMTEHPAAKREYSLALLPPATRSIKSVYWSTSVSIKQLHHLAEMSVPVSATDNRCHLHSATHGDLAVPRIRLARYGRRNFSVSGPLLWNSLPLIVRDVSLTLTQFCAQLKTFLFSTAYETSS